MVRIITNHHGKLDDQEPQKIVGSLASYSPAAMKAAILARHAPGELSTTVRAALGEILEAMRCREGEPPYSPTSPTTP